MGAARLSAGLVRPGLTAAAVLAAAAGGAGCWADDREAVVLVATTSTYDSGLLDFLIMSFETAQAEHAMKAIAVGSGEALELGRRGDADLLLVHAPAAERAFMEAGHGLRRVPLMYNAFVIVGPPDDPAGLRRAGSAAEAMAAIARAGAPFYSRGDRSGTHERELALWEEAGVRPGGEWYRETGQGQGSTLQLASERRAYTLVDRATYRTMRHIMGVEILHEGDPALLNLYSAILLRDPRDPEGAELVFGWLTSEAGRRAIGRFGRREHRSSLFTPLPPGDTLPAGHRGAGREPLAPVRGEAARAVTVP